jgi:uncharacterized protein YegP (UPF0339 family)
MSTRDCSFEVVITESESIQLPTGEWVWPAFYHCRFRADNGKIVWSTERYTRRRAAFRAIELFTTCPVTKTRDGYQVAYGGDGPIEVRIVDERVNAGVFLP